MDYPDWLGTLTKKEEHLRAAAGIWPGRDGWYKKIDGRKRYLFKPMSLSDAVRLLDVRIREIRGEIVEKNELITTSATTIKDLAEMFLSHMWQRHQTGMPRRLARRTYDDYANVLARFLSVVGPARLAAHVDSSWFTLFARSIARRAATSRRRDVIYIEAFFNWAGPGRRSQNFYSTPVQFGPDFKKPDESKLRLELAEQSTHYTPEVYRAAIRAVSPSPLLYAVGLLTFNAAFLPIDVATVPISAIDLDSGLHSFPRGKTSIPRKAVLMPETIAAIRRYLEIRPKAQSVDEPLFVSDNGRPFLQRKQIGPEKRAGQNNPISTYWSKVTGLQLKGLRTTVATELDGATDQNALDVIMGHSARSVRAKHYVKQFASDRLRTLIEPLWQRYVDRECRPSAEVVSAFALARKAEQPA